MKKVEDFCKVSGLRLNKEKKKGSGWDDTTTGKIFAGKNRDKSMVKALGCILYMKKEKQKDITGMKKVNQSKSYYDGGTVEIFH